MNKVCRMPLILAFVSAVLFIAQNFGCKAGDLPQGNNAAVGEPAPYFELVSVKGQKVALKDYRGKAVVLSFGTTWCPYCIKEIPQLKQIYENADSVEVIYIDVRESEQKVASLVKKYDIPYSVLLDKTGKTASEYKILGFPTVLIIDGKGIIVYRGHIIPSNLKGFI